MAAESQIEHLDTALEAYRPQGLALWRDNAPGWHATDRAAIATPTAKRSPRPLAPGPLLPPPGATIRFK
jgi:hypothetical protein